MTTTPHCAKHCAATSRNPTCSPTRPRAVVDWNEWKKQGLTQHRNQGVDPDPELLACDVSYETKRADLKAVPDPD